MAECEGSGEGH